MCHLCPFLEELTPLVHFNLWHCLNHKVNMSDIKPWVSEMSQHVTPQPGNYRFRPYTAITAGLQLLPEGLYLAQFHLVKGDWHLSNGVISAEAIVVQYLQVESSLSHLLIRKAWKKGEKEFQKMENIFLRAQRVQSHLHFLVEISGTKVKGHFIGYSALQHVWRRALITLLRTNFIYFSTPQAIAETSELYLKYMTAAMLMSRRSSHRTRSHPLLSPESQGWTWEILLRIISHLLTAMHDIG